MVSSQPGDFCASSFVFLAKMDLPTIQLKFIMVAGQPNMSAVSQTVDPIRFVSKGG